MVAGCLRTGEVAVTMSKLLSATPSPDTAIWPLVMMSPRLAGRLVVVDVAMRTR